MESDHVEITVTVNGTTHRRDVEPRLLLVDFLRDDLGLTGTHIGCDEGICGACTVEVEGEIIKSCLMFAVQADGGSITTVEGLSRGFDLHPIQQAFVERHAVQCGYCTPAFILATRSLLRTKPIPTREEIQEYLTGNLCRCGSYHNIIKAVQRAAELMHQLPSREARVAGRSPTVSDQASSRADSSAEPGAPIEAR